MTPSASPFRPELHAAAATPGMFRSRATRRLGGLLAALAVVIAACGPDSDPPGTATGRSTMPASTSPASTNPESPSGPPNDTGETLQLSGEKITFSAATLEAKAGQITIQFDNKDAGVPHNLHVTGNGIDEKTDVEAGPASQRLTLDAESGTYTFVCDVHPQQMTGDLVVT